MQLRSQDLQQRLRSKEQELEQLFQKQRRVSATTEHEESYKVYLFQLTSLYIIFFS